MHSPLFGKFRPRSEGDEIVILTGILPDNEFCRFMTSFEPSQTDLEIETTNDGVRSYRVLGYARDIPEGQRMLYGRVFS